MSRVWILGAGATIGHAAGAFPGIADFFSVAKTLRITAEHKDSNTSKPQYALVGEFLRQHFGESFLSQRSKIDVEQVLTYLDIYLERNKDPQILDVEAKIKSLIRDVLISAGSKLSSTKGEYALFKSMVNGSDSIVTFNWDVVLDGFFCDQFEQMYQMRNAGRNPPTQYRNFIDRFARREPGPFGSEPLQSDFKYAKEIEFPYKDNSKPMPLYLKAHGSIDWYTCTNEKCGSASELFVVRNPSDAYFCSRCDEKMRNVLIPPVLNKRLTDDTITRRVWSYASRILEKCDDLVVWGYSLPPTDLHSHWLLRQARTRGVKKLTIINPAIVSGGKRVLLQTSFIKKFSDMYLDSIEELHLFESMTDYHNNLDVYTKHPELFRRKAGRWLPGNRDTNKGDE